jgi:hypothetical protein
LKLKNETKPLSAYIEKDEGNAYLNFTKIVYGFVISIELALFQKIMLETIT